MSFLFYVCCKCWMQFVIVHKDMIINILCFATNGIVFGRDTGSWQRINRDKWVLLFSHCLSHEWSLVLPYQPCIGDWDAMCSHLPFLTSEASDASRQKSISVMALIAFLSIGRFVWMMVWFCRYLWSQFRGEFGRQKSSIAKRILIIRSLLMNVLSCRIILGLSST